MASNSRVEPGHPMALHQKQSNPDSPEAMFYLAHRMVVFFLLEFIFNIENWKFSCEKSRCPLFFLDWSSRNSEPTFCKDLEKGHEPSRHSNPPGSV